MDNFLIALLALSPNTGKVAKRLMDAVCYGIKRFLEPYFIAHDEKVKAKTDLEVFRNNPLRQLEFAREFMKNTDGRFPEEAVRDMANLFSVIRTAVICTEGHQLGAPIYSEAEDREWYARFFDEAKYISDEQLQEAWGRLLAERMIHPEGVNNRVLYFIRNLDKKEIETIRRALRVFLNDDFTPKQIIKGIDGLSRDMPALLSLGVTFEGGDTLNPMVATINFKEDSIVSGHGYDFKITPLGNAQELEVSCYALTPEGQVLSRLCETALTEKEAMTICDNLNACWKNEARVVVVEKNSNNS